MVTIQNSKRVWQALQKLELLAVAEYFMTPTAELADYVLPANTWLEKDELVDIYSSQYTDFIAAGQKVLEPLYEARDDREIVLDLLGRLSWADHKVVPWRTVEELNEETVAGTGLSFRQLLERGYLVEPMRYRKYEGKGFNTPTGKVELYSTVY